MKNITVQNNFIELVDEKYFNFETIQPLNGAKLASKNNQLLNQLGINNKDIIDEEIVDILNGKQLLKNSKPFSMVYAGHQFGYFVPQLGDGRAINIGDINGYSLQLKGSGLTKYSRQGDGRAVLRSTIREYLMSEAMYGLGIETTRVVAMISSEHLVYREYESEKSAIVLRASTSWIRVGHFEYFYNNGGKSAVKKLADFVINQSYPHLVDESNKYEKFYFELIDKSAKMVAKWQCVGFNHGVLNTDNTSVAGLTIDYGPFSFMDRFKMNNICNHIDMEGRYSFANQPRVIQWNLKVLASTLKDLVSSAKLDEINEMFYYIFEKYYYEMMTQKLGLFNKNILNYEKLIDDLLFILEDGVIDYNYFFHILSSYKNQDELLDLTISKSKMKNWLEDYNKALEIEELSKEQRQEKMRTINPKYILKNHILQEAINKANEDDFSLLNDLLDIAHNPYDEHKDFEQYCCVSPLDKSNMQLSCSS